MTNLLQTRRWIVQTKACSSPPRLRLFCFPYAGGGVGTYRLWSNYLPEDIEVCPIYLPGREVRYKEPAFTRLSPLVRVLAHVLRSTLDVPFALFGHSMGALISFELARYLRETHMPEPIHLFVSAHWAPQLPARGTPMHSLSDAAFIDKLAQFGGTPREVLQQTELMQAILPALRADFTLCETYTYENGQPLSYPITAFGGEQDTLISEQELQAWHEQTQSTFTLHMLPGDHFFLRDHARELVQQILHYL